MLFLWLPRGAVGRTHILMVVPRVVFSRAALGIRLRGSKITLLLVSLPWVGGTVHELAGSQWSPGRGGWVYTLMQHFPILLMRHTGPFDKANS